MRFSFFAIITTVELMGKRKLDQVCPAYNCLIEICYSKYILTNTANLVLNEDNIFLALLLVSCHNINAVFSGCNAIA
jgi:hypothetical protein